MPLLFSSQTMASKRSKMLHPNKAIKPMTASQWPRKKKRKKLLPVLPSKQTSTNSAKLAPSEEDHPIVQLLEEVQPNDVAGQHAHSKSAAASLEDILQNPIHFVQATTLTFANEMVHRKARKPLKNLTTVHELRRKKTGVISKKWSTSSKQPRLGLPNHFNLCYRRAATQALMNAPIVVNWAASVRRRHANKDNSSKCPGENCMICAFSRVADAAWTRTRRDTETAVERFDLAIESLAHTPSFDYWFDTRDEQADAQEYIFFIIEHLINDPRYNNPCPVVDGLFALHLRQQWTCQDCGGANGQPHGIDYVVVDLEILGEKKQVIQDPIADVFSPAFRDARCEQCKSERTRTVVQCIEAAPEVLFFRLVRFRQRQLGSYYKLTTPSYYPEHLDLSQYAAAPGLRNTQGALKYRLSSVVAHRGALGYGHYINYSFSPGSGYTEFSDSHVVASSQRAMLHGSDGFTPYLLMYVADDNMVGLINNRKG